MNDEAAAPKPSPYLAWHPSIRSTRYLQPLEVPPVPTSFEARLLASPSGLLLARLKSRIRGGGGRLGPHPPRRRPDPTRALCRLNPLCVLLTYHASMSCAVGGLGPRQSRAGWCTRGAAGAHFCQHAWASHTLAALAALLAAPGVADCGIAFQVSTPLVQNARMHRES